MRVRFSAAALRQVAAIGTYVARHNPRAALDVLAQIEATDILLEAHPQAGRLTSTRGVRIITVPRYPYRLFYTLTGEEAVVLRVRHTARRPLRTHR
jgi:addiction module RelE/StbE family toxin